MGELIPTPTIDEPYSPTAATLYLYGLLEASVIASLLALFKIFGLKTLHHPVAMVALVLRLHYDPVVRHMVVTPLLYVFVGRH